MRNCVSAGFLVMIPGTIWFLARGLNLGTMNVLIQEALWTGILCAKFVYPNYLSLGLYERDTPITMFPK